MANASLQAESADVTHARCAVSGGNDTMALSASSSSIRTHYDTAFTHCMRAGARLERVLYMSQVIEEIAGCLGEGMSIEAASNFGRIRVCAEIIREAAELGGEDIEIIETATVGMLRAA